MTQRRRVAAIWTDSTVLVGTCSFFLLKRPTEIRAFYHRPAWTAPPDHAEGQIAYIDFLQLNVPWSRGLKQALETAITDEHPEVRYGVWYRSKQTAERRYTWRIGR